MLAKSCVILLITAVGCAPVTQPPSVEVTDAMRSACPGSTDASLQNSVYEVARDAEAGVTYATELANRTQRCFSLDPNTCVPCQTAIVNGVYGR